MHTTPTSSPQRGSLGFLLILAAATSGLHLAINAAAGYGIFRDELYYLACANHPAAGYVDQPPFSIHVLAAWRTFFGDGLFSIRFLPAIAAGATVVFAGLTAREFGGSRYAQSLAAIATIVSPIFLGMNTIYSMNAFDILFWSAAWYLAARILHRPSATRWHMLGLIIGIGALNKISMLWLGTGLAAGLVLTPHRAQLRSAAPWIAAGIAVLAFLPYILWNISHDWAHLEFIHNATHDKYAGITRLDFIVGVFLVNSPFSVPLWIGGVLYLLFSGAGRQYRPLGIAYITIVAILLLNGQTKSEYLSPAYTMLFAAGGVMIERMVSGGRKQWLYRAMPVVLSAGIIFAPFTLPVLPVDTYRAYSRVLGFSGPNSEGKELAELPQFYADMFGWQEKTDSIAAVYGRLPAADRAICAIFATNYGRCGAVDYFGRTSGLPESIGCHNNYWLWGPRSFTGEVAIIPGGRKETWDLYFDDVQIATTVTSRYVMPYENNLPVYVCRTLRMPVADFWQEMKSYN